MGWGAASTVVVTSLSTAIWGRAAIVAAATFGGVATVMQMVAARVMAQAGTPSIDHLRVYALGLVFRLLGIVILGVVVSLDRTTFPPLASAAGYLGTVLPLLYLETRLSR